MIKQKEHFIIRAKKNRDVIYKGKRMNILDLSKCFKGKQKLTFRKKNGVHADCKVTIVPIRLPCMPKAELNLVICYGFGKTPLMLITNLKNNDSRLAIAVTKVYLMRWRIEEFYAFKKQQFGLEGLRVRSLNSIRNLDFLLTLAIGYLGYMSATGDERRIVFELIHISKRIKGIPKFFFYALADGLFTVFARAKPGIVSILKKKRRCGQLSLFPEPCLSRM